MTEIVVDLFAGGGGASEGIRWALGCDPDVAVNHDAVAVAVHEINHAGTWHLRQDIWDVHPRWAAKRRPVGLLWASPDCRHHSKAKGAAPTRDRKVRSLAWVLEKWILGVRPRVIILENVEEFQCWGPLDSEGKIVESQKGTFFKAFIRMFRRYGYKVDHKELRACDYGAPTIRKRLFLIARCDGQPIIWPEPTHGPGRAHPYRTAAEIIDWSLPCPSIFDRKKPLAPNTLRRIAEGTRRYVLETSEPFIVNLTHGVRLESLGEPLRTVTAAHRGEKAIITPYIESYYGPKHAGEFRGVGLDAPIPTQTTANRFALVVPHLQRQFGNSVGHAADVPTGTVTAGGGGKTALVAAFLAKHYGGVTGQNVLQPTGTITTKDHHSLVCSHLVKLRGTCRDGQPVTEPMPTLTAGGNHVGEVRAFVMKYYGSGGQWQSCHEPVHTVLTKDRLGLVTVQLGGEPYVIVDIGMRMLSPRELFRAQGFRDDYVIDVEVDGRQITKADKVRMAGNSVCPPIVKALVEANYLSGIRGKSLASEIGGSLGPSVMFVH